MMVFHKIAKWLPPDGEHLEEATFYFYLNYDSA